MLSWPEDGSDLHHDLESQEELTSVSKMLPNGKRSVREGRMFQHPAAGL